MFSIRRKKKKLSLEKIHELYLTLEKSIPDVEEKFLIDEVSKMMEKMNDNQLVKAMEIMYGKFPNENSIRIAVMFIRGLKENNFFDYVDFIRGLSGRRTD